MAQFYFGQESVQQPKPVSVVSSNMLTDDEIEVLKHANMQAPEELFKEPTDLDNIRVKCTHRDNTTGRYTLQNCSDSKGNPAFRCTICGKVLHYLDPEDPSNVKKVEDAVEIVDDAIESIKINSFQSPEAMKNVYIVSYINNQVPKMLRVTGEQAKRIKESFIGQSAYQQNGAFNAAGVYNAFTAGAFNMNQPTVLVNPQANPIPGVQYNPGVAAPVVNGVPMMAPVNTGVNYNNQAAVVAAGGVPGYAGASNPIGSVVNPQTAGAPTPAPVPAPQTTPGTPVPVQVNVGTPTTFKA